MRSPLKMAWLQQYSMVIFLALVFTIDGKINYYVKVDQDSNGGLTNGASVQNGVPSNECDPWRFNVENRTWSNCYKGWNSNRQCYLERPQFPVQRIQPKQLLITITGKVELCKTLMERECVGSQFLSIDLVIYYKHGLNPKTYKWVMPQSPVNTSVVFKEEQLFDIEVPALIYAMYLRLSPVQFCGSLLNVTLLSHVCPSVTKNLVKYPEASVDPNNVFVAGKCMENSVIDLQSRQHSLRAKCDATNEGGYHHFQGKCICKEGYTLRNNLCEECGQRKYKLAVGNEACTQCGEKSLNNGTQLCRCEVGYFRKYKETHELQKPCYNVKSFGLCPSETISPNVGETYHFPETEIEQTVQLPCIYAPINKTARGENISPALITRRCFMDVDSRPKWEDVDMSRCEENRPKNIQTLNEVKVSDKTVVSVSNILIDITSKTSVITKPDDVKDITDIMEKCLDIDGKNKKVSQNILTSINNILHVNKTIIAQSKQNTSDSILHIIEKVAANSIDAPVNFSGDNFGFAVAKTDAETDLYTNVMIPSADESDRLEIQFSTKPREDTSCSRMPAGLFIPKTVFKEAQIRSPAVYAYAFKKDSLFYSNQQEDEESTVAVGNVVSYILSTSIHNATVSNLKKPIELSFAIPNTTDPLKTTCSFWETENRENEGYWSTRGCFQSRVSRHGNQTVITCKCNHLTKFAVLFNIHAESDASLEMNHVLSLLSLIGCTVSIVCLIATLFCYLALREIRKRTVRKIIINFCFSLLFLLVTFVFGVDSVTPQWACHVTATLIHLFTLTTFHWMGVQAVFLYKKAVRATKNRGQSKRTYRIGFIVSWGVPVVIAGVTCFFTRTQFYGHHKERSFCVITGIPFYIGTLFPISGILLLNFTLFIPVIRTIQLHIASRSVHQTSVINTLWRRVKVTLSCTTLLGLTWIFGFFAVDNFRVPFQWMFCIANALQGMFLFIFHVLLDTKVSHAWKKIIFNANANASTSFDSSSRSHSQNRMKSDIFRSTLGDNKNQP